MNQVKKLFIDLKNAFTTDIVLKENERRANIVVGSTMLAIYVTICILCILVFFGLFDIDKEVAESVILRSTVFLLIPSITCFLLKGKESWLKFFLLIMLICGIAVVDSIITYIARLFLVIPVILAARYYRKRFTLLIAGISAVVFAFSAYYGAKVGYTDLNYVDVPVGTTINIETTLEDAVDGLNLDENQKAINVLTQSFLPDLIIYAFMIVFACIQISHSGKKMIFRQKELSESTARIESELSIATEIQRNILPTTFPAFPEHEEFDIYAEMQPAKEVGGDFYDMFLVDENHLAIVIADVSGKGVPAALIMMNARTLIKSTALNGYSVNEIFEKVNNLLCEGNKTGHFVTAWLGILDLNSGKLEFVNAGHNPPLIYSKKDGKYDYLRTKPNIVLAAMEDTKYVKHEITLFSQDKILLYTDGITEACNKENELYGEERLIEYLNKNTYLGVKEMIINTRKDIDEFVAGAEQFDDMTMLSLIYNGRKGEKK